MWLVDPDVQTVARVWTGATEDALGRGEVLTSSLLDGFALDVATSFR